MFQVLVVFHCSFSFLFENVSSRLCLDHESSGWYKWICQKNCFFEIKDFITVINDYGMTFLKKPNNFVSKLPMCKLLKTCTHV